MKKETKVNHIKKVSPKKPERSAADSKGKPETKSACPTMITL